MLAFGEGWHNNHHGEFSLHIRRMNDAATCGVRMSCPKAAMSGHHDGSSEVCSSVWAAFEYSARHGFEKGQVNYHW